jgi:hypothetical protein
MNKFILVNKLTPSMQIYRFLTNFCNFLLNKLALTYYKNKTLAPKLFFYLDRFKTPHFNKRNHLPGHFA